jgi:hypothetical protein
VPSCLKDFEKLMQPRSQFEPNQFQLSAASPNVGGSGAQGTPEWEGFVNKEASIGAVQFCCTIVPSSEQPEQKIIGLLQWLLSFSRDHKTGEVA